MDIKKVYARLVEQRDKAQAGIDALAPFIAMNGHKVMSDADVALDMVRKRGPYNKRMSRMSKEKRLAFMNNRTVNGKLPEMKPPSGLTLKGVELREAIRLAMKAVKKPLFTPQLTALLLTAGYEAPKGTASIPRLVGLNAASEANRPDGSLKRMKDGAWALR